MIVYLKKYEYVFIGVFVAVILAGIYLLNLAFPNDYYIYSSEYYAYDKAEVIEIMSEDLTLSDDYEGCYTGSQEITVEFISGAYKGEQISLTNSLSLTHNILVEEGSKIIIKIDQPEGVAAYYSVYGYARDTGLIIIGVLFTLVMLLIGKVKGIKSVIGLGTSLYIIVVFLLPAIYRGWSPIYMTIITVMLISTISFLLLNGFCNKTYTAIVSTIIGVLISVAFFYLFQNLLNLTGFNLEEADQLIMISRSTNLQINEVFFAAVMISSLGALIDTTMSIAAAMYEIGEVNPRIERKVLFQSGITIGQDMIGTMCQTLILAFVGSAIATLLVLISYGTQWNQFISSDYIALEVVQAISGSMAIIFAVPITAILSTIMIKHDK